MHDTIARNRAAPAPRETGCRGLLFIHTACRLLSYRPQRSSAGFRWHNRELLDHYQLRNK